MPTLQQIVAFFEDSDRQHFGGALRGGTAVEFMRAAPDVDLSEYEDGDCKKDGTLIVINPTLHEGWECTVLHEMVHAFEFRFGDRILATPEGMSVASMYSRPALEDVHGAHSAKFFTKLFEVIRQRGDDPRRDFGRYFG